jgi:TPR repeat protein
MSKTKILFLAADPLSAPDYGAARLQLDGELGDMQRAIRSSEFGHLVDVDVRLAVRTDDLLDALIETTPHVVHFSGHGRADGLVMVSTDGSHPHLVPAAAVAQVFRQYRGEIRLVFLNACFSLPQAEAIADEVGCAVGTSGELPDDAALLFGTRFYRAVASGRSVQAAYDEARLKLALQDHAVTDCPQLVVGPNVDASDLILVPLPKTDAKHGETGQRPGADLRIRSLLPSLVDLKKVARGRWRVPTMVAGVTIGGAALLASVQPKSHSSEIMLRDVCRGSPSVAVGSGRAELDLAKRLLGAGKVETALGHLQRAARVNNPEAMVILGYAYLRGVGTKPDGDHGLELLQRSAGTHDVCAMQTLAAVYLTSERRDLRWARYWLRTIAVEKGDPDAMRTLASTYTDKGPQDSARVWLQKAVAARSTEAMVDLGLMYEQDGRRQDQLVAMSYYHMAAELDSPRGMAELGRAYQKGVGAGPDIRMARWWYRKAAYAGSGDGIWRLGQMYENGQGVQRDCGEAMRWYRAARDAGSAEAEAELPAARKRCGVLRELYRRMFPLSSLPSGNHSMRQPGAV